MGGGLVAGLKRCCIYPSVANDCHVVSAQAQYPACCSFAVTATPIRARIGMREGGKKGETEARSKEDEGGEKGRREAGKGLNKLRETNPDVCTCEQMNNHAYIYTMHTGTHTSVSPTSTMERGLSQLSFVGDTVAERALGELVVLARGSRSCGLAVPMYLRYGAK